MINFKTVWSREYFKSLANGSDDQKAIDNADDYATEFMADYGDYLYEQEKDRRMMEKYENE